MVCKATDMCDGVGRLKPSKVVSGSRLEDIVTTMGRPGLMGVGSLHTNRSITHAPQS
ncbi:hypothetical protein Hanom_Chr11g01031071 [Helianthus anomalus]